MSFAAAVFGVEAWYIAASDLTFPVGTIMRAFWLLALILLGGLLARRYGFIRIGNTLQATAFAPIASAIGVVAMVILTRFTTAFADGALSGADQALGLDWMAMFRTFRDHPVFFEIARTAYRSFYWQFAVLCVVLFALDRQPAGFRFLNTWVIALALSVAIYPFFTAEGPYIRYGIVPGDIPNLYRDAPWTTGATIQGIRDHSRTDVIGSLTGLIFFPSFHAAGAVMYIRTWWNFGWLRWVAIPLNLLLIAAAPVFGLHYFIDLVGGIVVAVVAIVLAETFTRRIELRQSPASDGICTSGV